MPPGANGHFIRRQGTNLQGEWQMNTNLGLEAAVQLSPYPLPSAPAPDIFHEEGQLSLGYSLRILSHMHVVNIL